MVSWLMVVSGEVKVLDICLALISCVHVCVCTCVYAQVCTHMCVCVLLVISRVFLDCSPLYFKSILHLFVCVYMCFMVHTRSVRSSSKWTELLSSLAASILLAHPSRWPCCMLFCYLFIHPFIYLCQNLSLNLEREDLARLGGQ